MREPRGRPRDRWQIPPRDLVLPLGARLDAGQLVRDRVLDRAVVGELEVEPRERFSDATRRAPVPAKEGVGADQVEGGRDGAAGVVRDDEGDVGRGGAGEEGPKKVARQVVGAPPPRRGVDVEAPRLRGRA